MHQHRAFAKKERKKREQQKTCVHNYSEAKAHCKLLSPGRVKSIYSLKTLQRSDAEAKTAGHTLCHAPGH